MSKAEAVFPAPTSSAKLVSAWLLQSWGASMGRDQSCECMHELMDCALMSVHCWMMSLLMDGSS
jgi:hypothetical protein